MDIKKYFWSCNICGAVGRCLLPRHKAMRGARNHSVYKYEPVDVTLHREDGKVEILKEVRNEFSREISTQNF